MENADLQAEIRDRTCTSKSSSTTIRITNGDDHIIAEAKNGHIVFLEYLAVAHILDEFLEDREYDPITLMHALVGSKLVYEGSIPEDKEDAVYLLQRLYAQYIQLYKEV